MQQSFRGRSFALIGLPASGKTGVTKLLAGLLGLPGRDLDDAIEEEAGMDVPAIFAAEGEAGFRVRESRALVRIAEGPPLVLGTGGGTVLSPDNRRILRERFFTVWLQVSPGIAAGRAAGGHRPLLEGGDVEDKIRRLHEARKAFYEEAAHIRVDTDNLDLREVAEAIHDMLR